MFISYLKTFWQWIELTFKKGRVCAQIVIGDFVSFSQRFQQRKNERRRRARDVQESPLRIGVLLPKIPTAKEQKTRVVGRAGRVQELPSENCELYWILFFSFFSPGLALSFYQRFRQPENRKFGSSEGPHACKSYPRRIVSYSGFFFFFSGPVLLCFAKILRFSKQ